MPFNFKFVSIFLLLKNNASSYFLSNQTSLRIIDRQANKAPLLIGSLRTTRRLFPKSVIKLQNHLMCRIKLNETKSYTSSSTLITFIAIFYFA